MDVAAFAKDHVPQITAVVALVSYGIARNKFTPGGLVAGVLVSIIHMLHPWPVFFWLLTVFVFLGTLVTKVGHAAKSHLTQSSTGGSGGEASRSAAQVFANSGFACILVGLHLYLLASTPFISSNLPIAPGPHAPRLQKLLPIGIIAQYAAVAADTFSSELGILAQSEPFLITAPWKRVPKGTNGGVTVEGLIYGGLGSLLLTLVAILYLYGYAPGIAMNEKTAGMLVFIGLMGSVIDSLLGALVQATVTDRKSGKVVEGPGGQRVKVAEGGGRLQIGSDLLTNNGVNFVMAALTSMLAMGVAHVLGFELSSR
ncbi:uncharacterized protein LTR77_009018 [Saxophila tyrrhenica]|uniref:Transmembrane protein 19 n=1 Tax=Saxophila tyrrhenica TaxID=1690608 RepID=A0AAV9NZW5_9PEZI|nr:hypothetical protein LTR77_009018 [Saxophila tyrrhenica]